MHKISVWDETAGRSPRSFRRSANSKALCQEAGGSAPVPLDEMLSLLVLCWLWSPSDPFASCCVSLVRPARRPALWGLGGSSWQTSPTCPSSRGGGSEEEGGRAGAHRSSAASDQREVAWVLARHVCCCSVCFDRLTWSGQKMRFFYEAPRLI